MMQVSDGLAGSRVQCQKSNLNVNSPHPVENVLHNQGSDGTDRENSIMGMWEKLVT